MDSIAEQLIEKKATGIDRAKKAAIVILGMLLATIIMTISFITYIYVLIIISLAILYLTIFLLGRFHVEYEYIVTNDEIDIDKIIGKSKRKRLVTLRYDNAESFGIYEKDKRYHADTTVLATDGTDFGQFHLISSHKKLGRVMVIFTPNERLLDTMKNHLPGHLRANAVINKK